MRRLRIMLGDLSYFNKHRGWMQVVPINIGFVGQYINQEFGKDVNVSLYKEPSEFLEDLKETKPDIVGLSLYCWNTDLNRIVIKKIRAVYGHDVIVVLGGPSTDSEDLAKRAFLGESYGADALILEEGEVPFSDIVRVRLSKGKTLFSEPMNGIAFLKGQDLITGSDKSVHTDLSMLYSPYLSGSLNKFVHSDYMPLIQMSRYCPYSCAYCVSGKSRGKPREFPLAMIKEELLFISKAYADRPHFALQVADENFGIFKRDAEIAEHIRKCSDETGFPLQMFYYGDKRFTATARDIVKSLGKINTMGLQISLQSGNPNTLKMVRRKNLSEKDIDKAITWAGERGIETFTEFIFGMPNETLESFSSTLDRYTKRGFDSVQCHSLFLMAGIPLNTQEVRQKYKMQTKFRNVVSAYGEHDGDFSVEHEEIVVSTNTINFHDFMMFRGLSFLFVCVFRLGFYRYLFKYIESLDISLSKLFSDFMNPDPEGEWPEEYCRFISDFNEAANEELFDSREELEKRTKEIFRENGNNVAAPARINIFFGSRLIYREKAWVREVLKRHIERYVVLGNDGEKAEIINLLLSIGEYERIDIKNPKTIDPLRTKYDVIAWKEQQFKMPLSSFSCEPKPKLIYFNIKPNVKDVMMKFKKDFEDQDDSDFYYNAIDYILPRSNLLCNLSYIKS